MSLKGRLPWIVAGAAVAFALLAWESYRAEREKSAGVPEAVEKLAGKVERMKDMTSLKALAGELAASVPKSLKPGDQMPQSEALMKAAKSGLQIDQESPLGRLAFFVVDMRSKAKSALDSGRGFRLTADEAETLERLKEEVD